MKSNTLYLSISVVLLIVIIFYSTTLQDKSYPFFNKTVIKNSSGIFKTDDINILDNLLKYKDSIIIHDKFFDVENYPKIKQSLLVCIKSLDNFIQENNFDKSEFLMSDLNKEQSLLQRNLASRNYINNLAENDEISKYSDEYKDNLFQLITNIELVIFILNEKKIRSVLDTTPLDKFLNKLKEYSTLESVDVENKIEGVESGISIENDEDKFNIDRLLVRKTKTVKFGQKNKSAVSQNQRTINQFDFDSDQFANDQVNLVIRKESPHYRRPVNTSCSQYQSNSKGSFNRNSPLFDLQKDNNFRITQEFVTRADLTREAARQLRNDYAYLDIN